MRASVTRPTPHSRSTGSGSRNSRRYSGPSRSNPSGFDISLRIFAAILVGATPTETTSPVRSSTRRLSARDLQWRAEQPFTAGEIEKRFIERERLDYRTESVEDG